MTRLCCRQLFIEPKNEWGLREKGWKERKRKAQHPGVLKNPIGLLAKAINHNQTRFIAYSANLFFFLNIRIMSLPETPLYLLANGRARSL